MSTLPLDTEGRSYGTCEDLERAGVCRRKRAMLHRNPWKKSKRHFFGGGGVGGGALGGRT